MDAKQISLKVADKLQQAGLVKDRENDNVLKTSGLCLYNQNESEDVVVNRIVQQVTECCIYSNQRVLGNRENLVKCELETHGITINFELYYIVNLEWTTEAL